MPRPRGGAGADLIDGGDGFDTIDYAFSLDAWTVDLAAGDGDDYLEGKDVTDDLAKRLEGKFLDTHHKRVMPVAPSDTWWR